ncbi:MAG TPA: peptidylprolyl isomerase [Rickettsiales bacterium]|nr:peptidylprolyl isomerase [Rickettsiales bacterium]
MKKILLFIILFLNFSRCLFANNFDIVARINNEVITKYDLNNYSKIFKSYFTNSKFTNEEILDSLIEEKIKSEAIKNENITFDNDEFKYFLENFSKKNKIKITKNLRDFLKNRFLWSKLIETKIIPNINISSYETDDALEYLVENPVRTRYNISQITIYKTSNSNAKNIADKLYYEIKEKNNFEEIANKFSQYGKENKGYLGWIDENDINPDIYSAIKNLQINSITKPLYFGNSDSGYYMIVKLNNKKQERIAKNEDISRVRYILYNQKLNLEIKKYLDNLYNNSFIEKI